MTKRIPTWLRRRPKSLPDLRPAPPIALGPRSNGEFFLGEGPRDRALRAHMLQAVHHRHEESC